MLAIASLFGTARALQPSPASALRSAQLGGDRLLFVYGEVALLHFMIHQFKHTERTVERRSQLMTHHSEKLTFGFTRAARFFLFFQQSGSKHALLTLGPLQRLCQSVAAALNTAQFGAV